MSRSGVLIAFILVALAGAGAGYWFGAARNPLPAPGGEQAAGQPRAAGEKSPRKILYYRNPMGLPDISPVPKKDQMGMDYIPVYEGEESDPGGGPTVKINTARLQTLGVRTEAVERRALVRTVSAVGTVQVDERQMHTVAPKFEGWIERLNVNTTGQFVKRGEPLMEVYSPDLITAQQEYLIALKAMQALKEASPESQAAMRDLAQSALQRLRNWDIADHELQRLQQEGALAARTLVLRSPVSGVVLEKPAVQGMRFMPGDALFRISNLSSLWVLGEVFEQDLALVRPGQSAKVTVNAYPGKAFPGRVAFVYPTVTPETRTAKVRIELANPGGQLKPDMYATVELATGQAKGKVLAVPTSAVLDSGTRQMVLVGLGEGRFEPRTVKLGAQADGYVEVLEGVREGENVVVSANFLIDAESNLKAAFGAFGAGADQTPATGADAKSAGARKTHKAEGTVNSVNPQAGTFNMNHGPIPSLNWPAMTMDFTVNDKSQLTSLKPGQKVEIDIVQQGPGQFLVTRIAPAGGKPAASADHKH